MRLENFQSNSIVWVASIALLLLVGCNCDDDPVCPDPTPDSFTPHESTIIIPIEAADVVLAYDSGSGNMSLDETSEYGHGVSIGSILIGQNDEIVPDGFLRKVISITPNKGILSLETVPALLTEAFEQMDISGSHQLRPSQIKTNKLYSGATVRRDKDDETFTLEMNCVVYDQDDDTSTTGDQITWIQPTSATLHYSLNPWKTSFGVA